MSDTGDNDVLDDFLVEAKKRSRKPSAGPAPVPEAKVPGKVSTEEENFFRAASGLRFKCGVCSRTHKTSNADFLKTLKKCVLEVTRAFGSKTARGHWGSKRHSTTYTYENKSNSDGLGFKFLPNAQAPEVVALTYRKPMPFASAFTVTPVMSAAYPRFVARWKKDRESLLNVHGRELIEEVSIREALGAPRTVTFIAVRGDAFVERAVRDYDRVIKEAEREAAPILERCRSIVRHKPEKWEVTKVHNDSDKWAGRLGHPETVESLDLNGHDLDAGDILGSFTTISDCDPTWVGLAGTAQAKRLIGLGLVNGLPAISWGMLKRKSTATHKYQNTAMVYFLSTWDGKMYLDLNGSGDAVFEWAKGAFRKHFPQNYMELVPIKGAEMVEPLASDES